MTTPQPISSNPPVRPSGVVAGQSDSVNFNTDFTHQSAAETPAENCVSVVLPSDADLNTTPDQHKRAGGGLLGSAPRQTVASVVSAGQTRHSLDTDSESVVDAARNFFAAQRAAETDAQQVRAKKRSRIFSVMQYAAHPTTGEVMYCETLLQEGLARRSIRRWAWILHDRDANADGTPKPPHWHLVLECEDACSIRQVSNWFSVPSARVRVPKESGLDYAGRGARERAFFDLVRYLVHENGDPADSKVKYSREEVKSNDVALWEALDAHMADRRGKAAKGYGRHKDAGVDELVMLVQEEGWTKRQARRHNPLAYSRAYARIDRARATYLADAPLPPMRTNFYIGGPSRTGKSVLALLFARAIAKAQFPDLTEDEAIFQVGRPGAAFQAYDGQPILLWDDFRPLSIIEAVGGDVKSRDSVWPVLDIAPKRVSVNIKYGSAVLANAVNIITGVKSYGEFLDGLAGDFTSQRTGETVHAEDRNQAYGRFPFVSEVTAETIQFYLSRGFSEPGGLYTAYEEIARMGNSMKSIIETVDALPTEEAKNEFRDAVGQRMLGSMVQAHLDLTQKDSVELADAMRMLEAAPSPLTGGEILADDLARWRAQAEAGRAEWEAKWARAKATPPPGVYDKWLDDYVAWAAKNGGVAEARRRMISGEGPLPPELVQPPESTRYESPRQSPGISFDL